jgi:dipeptidyl-peptidase-4
VSRFDPVVWVLRGSSVVAALTVLAISGPAQTAPTEASRLTLARIFGSSEFEGETPAPAHWFKDRSAYLALERTGDGEGHEIVQHDPLREATKVVVSAQQLVPDRAKQALNVADFAISQDGRKLLLFTDTRKVWRLNTRGNYWVLDLDIGRLRKLGGNAPKSSLMFAAFDPAGRRVAYVRENNLYVEDLAEGKIVPLTSDGSPTRINGTFDWVYEEELFLREGFRWSPDGQSIAYWQIDSSGVPQYPMLATNAGLYPKVVTVSYPKTGQKNPSARIGIVPATGGATRWLDIPGDPRQNYLVRMDWVPESSDVVFQSLNRRQDTLRVMLGDSRTGAVRTILTNHDDAWVDVHDDLKFFDKGTAFTWTTDRDGWRRLETLRAHDGGTPRRLATGDFDVISVQHVDERNGCVYFLGSPENPTQQYLYRNPLDGSGSATRVTPADQPGFHRYQFSPDGQWAFQTFSSFGRPPITELVHLPDHRVARTMVGNAKLRAKIDALDGERGEFFRVEVGDRVVLDGWCIKPPSFDATKQYPVLVHVYGEPAAQNVLDRWGGEIYLWHRMLAQRGYIVLSVDNRGTPSPRGRDWRKCIYGKVGILAPREQAEAMKALLKRWSFLDPKRVGIWGWSGGGSMTLDCIFRFPELFQTGIAIAFVADQRFYDTIYQERYMGLPEDNPEGYKLGSPITHAGSLKGNLLLIHGTGDDNVHYQNLEALVNRLIALNKPFSMMSYPNRTHSISEGEGTRRHLFELMTRFLEQNLQAGARD